MKKIILAISVLAAFSCNKELNLNNQATDAAPTVNISNAGMLNRQTRFGAMLGGGFTNDKNLSMTGSLNVGYVRFAIIMSEWKGKSLPYESYTANGVKVLLNVNNSRYTGGAAFPKELTSYRQKLTEITNTYQPEVIAIENEEINNNYHRGSMADYINMLKVALEVCHAKNIKVTNGGIYGSALEVLTYRYLQTKGQNRADSFGNNCMETFQIKAAQTPGKNLTLEAEVRRIDTLLNFYGNLDYVNLHLYEPFAPAIYKDATKAAKVTTSTPVVIADLQEYIIARTGKQAMTNEIGQRNNTSRGSCKFSAD
jgi:Holliday junction resolvasome RuvABC endonuclease subunit